VTLAALAVLVYAAVLADAVRRAHGLGALVAEIGLLGLIFLALVLWRSLEELLPAAMVCLGGAYAVSVIVHGASVDERAPLVAAGLLLCCELSAWSLDERLRVAVERGVVGVRAAALAALAGGALTAAALVVAVAAAPAGRGLVWTVAGAASAVLVVALAIRAGRR